MKIITLVENSSGDIEELKCEHGLSFYIEYNNKKILFDTGQSNVIIENAIYLNKDLTDLDYLVMSHGHYDHAGGFNFISSELADKTQIFVGKGFFDPKYKVVEDGYKANGIDFNKKDVHNLNLINVTSEIDDIVIFKGFDKFNDYEYIPSKYKLKIDGEYVADKFDDEIALGLKYKDGIVLIVGCSHIGIVNILTSVIEQGYNVKAVLGGSHLVNSNEERVSETIAYTNSLNMDLVSYCHCSGLDNIKRMEKEVNNFVVNYTGKVITL
jgi:7,8-dihydropterin-6-yl-methyl-4-(beta-D-ribofuranosyl)aminobenzene 5'-phosphate synthase